MALIPEWTEREFEIVVKRYEELLKQLPIRTIGAITTVEAGIHSYHRGGNISMLSQMMLQYLDRRQGALLCPKCGKKF